MRGPELLLIAQSHKLSLRPRQQRFSLHLKLPETRIEVIQLRDITVENGTDLLRNALPLPSLRTCVRDSALRVVSFELHMQLPESKALHGKAGIKFAFFQCTDILLSLGNERLRTQLLAQMADTRLQAREGRLGVAFGNGQIGDEFLHLSLSLGNALSGYLRLVYRRPRRLRRRDRRGSGLPLERNPTLFAMPVFNVVNDRATGVWIGIILGVIE